MKTRGDVKLTDEQKAKVLANVGKIVEYIRGIQDEIVCNVCSSWCLDQYGLTITRNTIIGESPTHRIIVIDRPEGNYAVGTPLDEDLDFAVSLVAHWASDVKIDIESYLEDQRLFLKALDDFEV